VADLPRIGTDFAGYRIDSLIGRGGMSVVYRAENPRLGNMLALKLLAPELANDEVFRERFVRESRLAAGLNHPNIIPIYDAGAHDGVLYIAMRYVEGSDLKAMIRGRGPLPPNVAVAVLTQVARALDAAHARGLVHRDVKPANILVERSGDDEGAHAYLADFGLMKHPGSRSGLTATGQFMGTIDYVAPEQIEGKHVDARTDVYSLGCVLYECLTGRVPFVKDADVAIMWAHVNEAPERVSSLRPDLPRGIDDVIARGLAKSPDDRYASCSEMLAAAAAALAAREETRVRPTPAPVPPPITEETRPAAAPHPPRRPVRARTAAPSGGRR
jgi:serine/threonine protein kinase